jgi:hypothetical protein
MSMPISLTVVMALYACGFAHWWFSDTSEFVYFGTKIQGEMREAIEALHFATSLVVFAGLLYRRRTAAYGAICLGVYSVAQFQVTSTVYYKLPILTSGPVSLLMIAGTIPFIWHLSYFDRRP